MHNHVTLDALERAHTERLRPKSQRPSLRELALTILVAVTAAPFLSTIFLLLPLMGQVGVGAALLVTCYYLVVRRSLLVLLAAGAGVLLFLSLVVFMVQGGNYRGQMPITFFMAFGGPVTIVYCLLVSARIYVLKGGE